MISLVVGMGQIGQAVAKVTESQYSYDLRHGDLPKIEKLDIMHVCFPYSSSFIDDVQSYIEFFKPIHVAVWSTVPIGTCEAIDKRIVHTPVEGVHPELEESIRIMQRFVGYNLGAEARFFESYFKDFGLIVQMIDSTKATELYKLRSTAKYGINLVWTEYEAKLCEQFGVPHSGLMAYDRAYNRLYDGLGKVNFRRYVLYPPDGEIGGHCIVPNARLLNEQAPSDLLDKIAAMEKK